MANFIKTSDTSWYDGDEALNEAARKGDLGKLRELLPEASDFNKARALSHATDRRQGEAIWLLLEAGVDADARDESLQSAVGYGQPVWVQRLLDDGTSEQGRDHALNKASEWKRDAANGVRFTNDEDRLACVRLVLDAGVSKDGLNDAIEKATAYDDNTLLALLT